MATKRIMIIDDEIGFTNLVKLNLERTRCFEVHAVNNPLDAVAAAKAFKPHLILLDVMMPNKDGGELLAELEADEQLKNIPVMFLTASTTSQLARAEQTVVYGRPAIAKPVEPDELISRINEALGISIFGFRLNWGKNN